MNQLKCKQSIKKVWNSICEIKTFWRV